MTLSEAKNKWPEPCEAYFEMLVAEFPEELVRFIQEEGFDHLLLTFALEKLAKLLDSDLAKSILVPFLEHPNSLVREGAILGLSNHIDDSVKLRLKAKPIQVRPSARPVPTHSFALTAKGLGLPQTS